MKELSVLCLVKPAGNIAGKNALRKAQQVLPNGQIHMVSTCGGLPD
jgi:hypothetical protein